MHKHDQLNKLFYEAFHKKMDELFKNHPKRFYKWSEEAMKCLESFNFTLSLIDIIEPDNRTWSRE